MVNSFNILLEIFFWVAFESNDVNCDFFATQWQKLQQNSFNEILIFKQINQSGRNTNTLIEKKIVFKNKFKVFLNSKNYF